MKTKLIAGGAALAMVTGGYHLTREAPNETAKAPLAQGAPIVDVTLPATLGAKAELGKRTFHAVCATCHGENASGKTGFGPPLVHVIYEPSHHADMAFQLAVQSGVRAHHWTFGDMPAQDGLTKADVAGIINYVRELQRANGIN